MASIEETIQEVQAFAQKWFGITLRDHQLEWLEFLLRGGSMCLLLSPRRHGKTVLMKVYMAWRVSKDPTIRITIVGNTESLASGINRAVQRLIEGKAKEWEALYGIKRGKPWKATECALFGQPHADPVLSSKATRARVTGMSNDLILMDDVIIPDNITTPQQYRKLKAWIDGELFYTLDPMKEKVVILGTRKGMTDWYSELLDNPDVDSLVYQAIITDEDGTERALWPQETDFEGRGFTMEALAKKKRSNPALFDREWMNRPSLSKGYHFRREDIKRYGILPPHKWLRFFMGIDPAFGKEKRSSMTAICVIAYDERFDYVYIVEMFKSRMPLREQIEKTKELYDKWEPEAVIIESVMAFGMMYDEYEKAIPRTEPLVYSEKLQKELRIESTLAPLFRDGLLKFREEEDHFTRLFIETELLEFGGGGETQATKTPMDLLDALCISMNNIDFGDDDSEPLRAINTRMW